MNCFCGKNIPKERIELGYTSCINCSNENKMVSFMVYSHKTAPEIMSVRPEDKEGIRLAERANRRGR
jgi:hypothetical protein